MLRALVAVVVALVMSTGLAFAGDPVGRYSLVGSNPGNMDRYAGTVTVERTGETFRVTWDIGSQTFIGTGIGSDKGFAVSFAPATRPVSRSTAPRATIGKESGPIPAARPSAARFGRVSKSTGPIDKWAPAQVS